MSGISSKRTRTAIAGLPDRFRRPAGGPTEVSAALDRIARAAPNRRDPERKAAERPRVEGVGIIRGPAARRGALGPMASIRFRGPEGNPLEIASHDPADALGAPGADG